MNGTFLGRTHEADEALMMTDEGDVVRTRAITPRHDGVKVTKAMLLKLKAYPWDTAGTISHEQHLPTYIPDAVNPEGGEVVRFPAISG